RGIVPARPASEPAARRGCNGQRPPRCRGPGASRLSGPDTLRQQTAPPEHPPDKPPPPPPLTDTDGITAMAGPITRQRDTESLKTAASWPGADRNTTVTLAIRLPAARAEAAGGRHFSGLAG